MGPILLASLEDLVNKTGGRGVSGVGGGSDGGATANDKKPLPRGGSEGDGVLQCEHYRPVS